MKNEVQKLLNANIKLLKAVFFEICERLTVKWNNQFFQYLTKITPSRSLSFLLQGELKIINMEGKVS